jgi:hypothetical protein
MATVMEAFPFTEAEWAPVKAAALSILNAQTAGDEVLGASLRLDMLDLLAGLRERHGDHPVLLETVADYTDDDTERAVVYRQAADIAEANGLPTLSIRLFFARVLLDLGQPGAARKELRACEGEARDVGGREQEEWVELLEEASRAEPPFVLFHLNKNSEGGCV